MSRNKLAANSEHKHVKSYRFGLLCFFKSTGKVCRMCKVTEPGIIMNACKIQNKYLSFCFEAARQGNADRQASHKTQTDIWADTQ